MISHSWEKVEENFLLDICHVQIYHSRNEQKEAKFACFSWFSDRFRMVPVANFMENIFNPFKQEMEKFESDGIVLIDGTKTHVTLSKVVCDNLAQYEILGLPLSFGKSSTCRECLEKYENYPTTRCHSIINSSGTNIEKFGHHYNYREPKSWLVTKLNGIFFLSCFTCFKIYKYLRFDLPESTIIHEITDGAAYWRIFGSDTLVLFISEFMVSRMWYFEFYVFNFCIFFRNFCCINTKTSRGLQTKKNNDNLKRIVLNKINFSLLIYKLKIRNLLYFPRFLFLLQINYNFSPFCFLFLKNSCPNSLFDFGLLFWMIKIFFVSSFFSDIFFAKHRWITLAKIKFFTSTYRIDCRL